ncbi:MAG: cysteine--tRNA ligase [Actinobacteria bacterium]|nr:cysteine--tRNA ligase [Actinomycetota bacterium]
MLHLFDTAQGKVVPFEPREPGKVSMYVCGPTVYGPPHLGHGRFSLVFDVLRRYLTWTGLEVNYVSNITDIDDKIIQRANDEGREWSDIAQKCEQVWWKAMEAIGVERPTSDPHATAYVDQMVELIADLIARDVAYVSEDGVYFIPAAVADYGLLARQSIESLQAGARVEVADHKHSPIDFALWKFTKPGEPSWPSPWGEGRPGWHTECVVMSLDLLGDDFDLHGGGQDLAFPHHENERAQALAAGRTFARHWMHNGFVEVSGEKMSKSLGNFTNLLDLVESTDPRAYRLLVLRSHYRTPVEVTHATTDDASAALRRLDAFARRAANAGLDGKPDAASIEAFRVAMDSDLDTPAAVALLFGLVGQVNTALDAGDSAAAAPLAAAAFEICRAVGLVLNGGGEEVPAEILERAKARDEAREAKDWAAADAIRDELTAAGWLVEDTADGTQVRPA